MNYLNNRPVTPPAPSQPAEFQFPLRQRGMNFLARIGKYCSMPGSALSQASITEDMSAATSRSRMDDAQETNTGSWKKILNDWINDPQTDSEEKSSRKIAAERISDCIIKNGEHLDLSGLELSSLPPVLHHCNALKKMSCHNNQLTRLNLEGCKALEYLDCYNNRLAQLNLKGCKILGYLSCRNNQLTRLNLEGCKALRRLDCENNQLTQLNLEGCKALGYLSCHHNQLAQLNLEGCKALKFLYCNHNQLARLNLKGCKALETLDCNHNQLAQLNLEGCKALGFLHCNHNQLAQLNLKGCKALGFLSCHNNQLARLNFEDCKALKFLHCEHNQLTQLNLEGYEALNTFDCSNNNQLRFDHLDFLLSMRNLSHIECSNTAIGWHQLPEAIRNNPAIYIDIRPQQERHQALNHAQNTHVQSIHRCVSQNAKALKSKNSTQNLEQAYSEFCAWINQLPADGAAILEGYANDHFKNLTAKEWIVSPHHLEHRDQTSGVSVKEFLALAWLAAKDPAQREPQVSEAAAKETLVNALYEIRRGYNLDDAHNPKDNGATAHNICAGGTFNKISEKLVSVIQGAASFMVTSETFRLSLTSTLKRAVEVLRKDNRSVDDELNENDNLLTAPVWEEIKTGVITSIKAEFKDDPVIAGKDLDQYIREQTDYDQVLQYFSVL